jgi:hypothetical protein
MNLVRGSLLALLIAACVLSVGGSVAWATVYYQSTYAKGWDQASGAAWTGARANIEVRSGLISDADAADYGFVAESLWIGPDMTGTYWVEVGATRGWQGDNILTFYWVCQNASAPYYHEHKVRNLNAANYVGTTPEFKIVHGSGNNWNVLIDGTYADDANDDHSAATPFSSIDHFDVGLESNCSSGKMGAATNYVNASGLQRRVSSSTWGNAPAYSGFDGGFQLDELNTSSPFAHGDWTTSGRSLWNYRND